MNKMMLKKQYMMYAVASNIPQPTAELTYSLSSDGSYYTVIGVDSSWAGGDLIIPSTYNGLPVQSINSRCFIENKKITSVTILEGQITNIGSYAFYYCSKITNVILSKNIKYIRSRAFMDCYSLKNIIFPETLQLIEDSAFYDCASIYDFRKTEQVPTLVHKNAIYQFGSKIVVPDSLYDSWITATNWSSLSSYIVKASDYEASL